MCGILPAGTTESIPTESIPYSSMTASQISTTNSGTAARALTALPQATWPGTCTHTSNQAQAWWKVVLHDTWDISSVRLTNRQGCCPERLQGIDIWIGSTRCAASVSVGGGETKTVTCVGTGNEIKVQHRGTSVLTICGFAVQGTKTCTHTVCPCT